MVEIVKITHDFIIIKMIRGAIAFCTPI